MMFILWSVLLVLSISEGYRPLSKHSHDEYHLLQKEEVEKDDYLNGILQKRSVNGNEIGGQNGNREVTTEPSIGNAVVEDTVLENNANESQNDTRNAVNATDLKNISSIESILPGSESSANATNQTSSLLINDSSNSVQNVSDFINSTQASNTLQSAISDPYETLTLSSFSSAINSTQVQSLSSVAPLENTTPSAPAITEEPVNSASATILPSPSLSNTSSTNESTTPSANLDTSANDSESISSSSSSSSKSIPDSHAGISKDTSSTLIPSFSFSLTSATTAVSVRPENEKMTGILSENTTDILNKTLLELTEISPAVKTNTTKTSVLNTEPIINISSSLQLSSSSVLSSTIVVESDNQTENTSSEIHTLPSSTSVSINQSDVYTDSSLETSGKTTSKLEELEYNSTSLKSISLNSSTISATVVFVNDSSSIPKTALQTFNTETVTIIQTPTTSLLTSVSAFDPAYSNSSSGTQTLSSSIIPVSSTTLGQSISLSSSQDFISMQTTLTPKQPMQTSSVDIITSSSSVVEPEPEPEPETTPKPIPTTNPINTSPVTKQDTTVKAEPTTEPTGEPEDKTGSPEPEFKFDPDAFVEPGPDWNVSKTVWKEAWEVHVYFFGGAFTLLGVYCFICVIRLWYMDHLLSKHYFLTLSILVIIVCALRAVYLFIDAYNSQQRFPIILNYFLYSTVGPCLTAMFSILFYALLLATRVRVLSKKVQKLWVLLFIVSVHFLLSFATDIIVALFATASIMLFVCQAFFILWGLTMFIGYLVIFRRVFNGAINREQNLMRSVHDRKTSMSPGYHDKQPKHRYTLGLGVKITLTSACFGIAYVGCEFYGIFGVFGILDPNHKPQPWPWWIYHFLLRTLELCMCFSVTYVATQPLKYVNKKSNEEKLFYKLPCKLICCHDKLDSSDEFSSVNMDYCVSSDTDHLSWLKRFKNKKITDPDAPYPPHAAEKYTDPDATLLVRKIKQKPSMLVVEDGFVRIRREDEMIPTHFEVESNVGSSRSSDMNRISPARDNFSNVSDLHQTGNVSVYNGREGHLDIGVANAAFSQDDNRQSGYTGDIDSELALDDDSIDATDVDIVITESEHSDNSESLVGQQSDAESNRSVDMFRPLSMIDLAASMESELERAFHSSCVADLDLISHNSLPASIEAHSSASKECVYNEPMYERYLEGLNKERNTGDELLDSSGDSQASQSVLSMTRLLQPPVRRCNSAGTKHVPKSKIFENKKYLSLSDIEQVGKTDDSNSSSDIEMPLKHNTFRL